MSPLAEAATILHVDDDNAFLDLASRALERTHEQLTVVSETSAADGLATLYDDETDVDCVVSDYEMPQMDGLEFLVAVRSEFPDIPFVLFTGKGTEEIASRAITAGVTDYLQKGPGLDRFQVLANRLEMYVSRARERFRLEALERELTFWKEVSPAVVVVDVDGRVISVSAACRDLFAVDELAELVGVDIETLVHPDERNEVGDVMRAVKQDGTAQICPDRTIVRFGGEPVQTTVQWRSVDHWGQEALLAVMNDFPVEAADVSASP